MKRHERLAVKADNHRTLAIMLAAFVLIGGAVLGSAIRFEIHQAILPGLAFSTTSAVFCCWQLVKWLDASRTAELARIFDREDMTR